MSNTVPIERRPVAPTDLAGVMRRQPRPVRLTGRGELVVLLGVALALALLGLAAYLSPVVVLVGP